MLFDYCEFEEISDQTAAFFAGCRFADEPDELYVIRIDMDTNGTELGMALLFNGMDCKYSFKPEERQAVIDYVRSSAAGQEYEQWLGGNLSL